MVSPANYSRPPSGAKRACQPLGLTVAAITAIVSLAACGSTPAASGAPSSASPAAAAAPARTTAATAPAATAPATAPGSTRGTPASAAPAACAARDLRMATSGFYNGAGGFTGGIVLLVNKGTHACVLDGYPGLELLTSGGKVITNAARRCAYLQCPTTATRIVLSAGHVAHFEYVWLDNPQMPRQRTCPQSRTALVTPPGAYDHQAIPLLIAPCGIPPVLGVGTVQAGSGPGKS